MSNRKQFSSAWMTVASAPGTGNVTLGAAVRMRTSFGKQVFLTFVQAGFQNGDTFSYKISDKTVGWEEGEGTYNAGVVTRDTVFRNSLGTTAKLSFTADARIAPVLLSEDITALQDRAGEVIDPMAYGAAGDFDADTGSGTDDTAALLLAAARASATGRPLIITRKHKLSYYAHADHTDDGLRTSLLFSGAASISIIGRGGGLFFSGADRTDYANILRFEDCDRVFIGGDLTLDWVKRPFVQGRVTDIQASYIEVDLDEVPSFSDCQRFIRRKEDGGVGYTVRDRPAGTYDAGSTMTLQSGTTYRVDRTSGTWNVDYLSIGDRCILVHQVFGMDAIRGIGCRDVEIGAGVKIRAAAGMGYKFENGERLTGRALHVAPPAGARLYLSTNADGVHVGGFDEVNIINERVEYTGDDCYNIHGYASNITSRDGNNQFTADLLFPYVPPDIGDRLYCFDTNAVDTQIVTVADIDVQSATGPIVVTTVETLDADMDSGWRFASIDDALQIKLSGGEIGHNMGRGILCSARKASIKDIDARGCGQYAVRCHAAQSEYTAPDEIVLDGIGATGCNKRDGTPVAAVLSIRMTLADGATPADENYAQKGIIKNSRVRDTNNSAFSIMGIKEAALLQNESDEIGLSPFASDDLPEGGLFASLINIDNAMIEGNVNLSASPVAIETSAVDTLKVGDNVGIIAPISADYVGAARGIIALPTLQLIKAANIIPSSSRTALYDAMIRTMMDAGALQKMLFFYCLAGADNQIVRIDITGAHRTALADVGTVTFSADAGLDFDGSGDYCASPHIFPTTGRMERDNHHLGVYCTKNVAQDQSAIGTSWLHINPRRSSGGVTASVRSSSSTTNNPAIPGATSVGHFILTRDNSSDYDWYPSDGVKVDVTQASAAPAARAIDIGGNSQLGQTNNSKGLAVAHGGLSLTAAEIAAVRSAVSTYLAGL